jgi:peptidoglycan/xylan/chitin deacetylase (PgdA/CDA1 family)
MRVSRLWFFLLFLTAGLFLSDCGKHSRPSQSTTPAREVQSLPSPEAYKSPTELEAQHADEQAHGVVLRKLFRGDTKRRWIALTFDDGPHPQYTPRIVEILRQHKVHATFFVVGKMAKQYPQLVQLLQQSGNEIGNHTYDHVNLTRLSDEEIATEIEKCGEVVRSITGKTPTLFRPPGGDYNQEVASVAERLGYWMVLWTDDPGDYASPPKSVLEERLFSQISSGGIILLHDGVPETLELLPKLIKWLQEQGYEIVPAGRMVPPPSSPHQ